MRFKLLCREKAAFRKSGINCGTGVTLAQNKAVAPVPLGIFGVIFHNVCIKDRHNIGNGKHRPDVTAAG